jgi:antitoxin ChpS
MANSTAVSALTERAAKAFAGLVRARYPVQSTMLFGSRARRDHRADSDADVAVILRGEKGPFVDTKLAMADLAYEVLLETGVHIQPLPLWEYEWAHPQSHRNPRLLQNIARDGIRL